MAHTKGKRGDRPVSREGTTSARPSRSPSTRRSISMTRSPDVENASSLSEAESSNSEPARPSIGQTLADQFRARALAQSTKEGDSDDDLNLPPALDIAGIADDEDLPDLDLETLTGARPKRSTAKTDAYKMRAPKFAPSQRRQDAAKAKESAAVKAGITSPLKTSTDKELTKLFAQRKKMKQMGTDLAGMEEADRFMLTFTQQMASRGQTSTDDEDDDGQHLDEQSDASSSGNDALGGRTAQTNVANASRKHIALSDSEAKSPANEIKRVDNAIRSRGTRKKRKAEHGSESPEANEAEDVLAILHKDRSPGKMRGAHHKLRFKHKQMFWTSVPVPFHLPRLPPGDNPNPLTEALADALSYASGQETLAALLRSELFASFLALEESASKRMLDEEERRASSPLSSTTSESNAPSLAEWLTKLILQVDSPALSASAFVGLRKLLLGLKLAKTALSAASAILNDALVAVLTALPAALADLGASHQVLAAMYDCDVSDIATEAPLSQQVPQQLVVGRASHKGSSAWSTGREDALERLLNVLGVIADLIATLTLDSQAVLACNNTAVLLLFLFHLDGANGRPSRSYCTTQHAELIAKFQGVQKPARPEALLDHSWKCSARLLAAIGAIQCDEAATVRIILAMPSLDLQGAVARSRTAYIRLLRSSQADSNEMKKALPLESLANRLNSSDDNPLHVRRRPTNTSPYPDDLDYEELGCRVRLLSIILSDLPLQLCDHVETGETDEASSFSTPTNPTIDSIVRANGSGTSSQRSVETLIGATQFPIFRDADKSKRRIWSAAMDEAVALANEALQCITRDREIARSEQDNVPMSASAPPPTSTSISASYHTAASGHSSTTVPASLRFEPSTARYKQLSMIADHIKDAGGRISDGRGGHLARSRVKDDMQRLSLSIKYRLTALAPAAEQSVAYD
ncbi:hypothetical protein IE81DRAFT_345844 [Ceraceosorus guamensis]|uniref:Uncharacterized protein n=1 Tax=Ceraceosorus guamensis TaxID=1522189 RepID=A0A316W369_9BASI|nr:hypothetical protein IE81DRAFT_345844 [Ceraceosorus guamensis]PWN44139.1 hypothetical protein IE81DRAFT_345844 [Ceraceosorus guamensis]